MYTLLILEADSATGIVQTNPSIFAAGYGFVLRSTQHAFEQLAAKGYIRRFSTPGSHHPYPILVNKYLVTHGERKGLLLNSEKSSDWRNPVYEPREEHVQEDVQEHVQDVAPVHIQDTKTPRNNNIASPSASAAGRNGSGKHHGQDDYLTIARNVFAYYLQALAKNQALYRFTDKRRQMLKARAREAIEIGQNLNPDLKGPTLMGAATEAMCRCVDAIRRSSFHMGQNDRAKVYADLQHIFGSTERMEKWMGEV